ncbi:MAG: MATE family efflux transporter [Eubacterium sp.]|nr:MATE family efflux transporter [Eubacterium sp.]
MKKDYLKKMRNGEPLSLSNLLSMTIRLSVPTMLAQVSIILMEYIDAAMVGRLGGNATAAIGLVSSTTWLMGGICHSSVSGFSVLASQHIGANDESGARRIMKQAFIFALGISAAVALAGSALSGAIPVWLGGEKEILSDASRYLLIIALTSPVYQFNSICVAMLQASGNTKTPSVLETMICILNVPFNYLFIFVLKMGVTGAALGTALAEAVMMLPFGYLLLVKSPVFRLRHGEKTEIRKKEVLHAFRISLPLTFEQTVMCTAQIMSIKIVSPLGTEALAANSLAVTAESLCYMPGYGISSAAAAMIGQSIGAKRRELQTKLSYITVGFGMAVMGISGAFMYFAAPAVMKTLTPVAQIASLGAAVLRIEAFAEPMFAASIVSSGVFRGAGDTLVPSIMNLVCMWAVRLPLSAFLAGGYGLRGVWTAMCIELCVRGSAFLIRLIVKNIKLRREHYERV